MSADGESWEEMVQRVEAETVDESYAKHLFNTMGSYQRVGFTDAQAWELILEEHYHRLNLITQRALHTMYAIPQQEGEEDS